MTSDVLIIGSGMGGATVAAELAKTGAKIKILERGQWLTDCPEARDSDAIFAKGHFRPDEEWLDATGTAFNPGNFYYVGGNSKLYGAVLMRFRAQDFRPTQHMGGLTRGWPYDYEELYKTYKRAEDLYKIRGSLGEDPTDPPRDAPYPFAPVPDEPVIADLRRRWQRQGLHPASLPLGVDLDRWLQRGQTPWDGHPDTCGGKMDAETAGLAEALKHPNVELLTGVRVTRLQATDGRITGVEVLRDGTPEVMRAPIIVLAAGAVNSAALLLRSGQPGHPGGLANSSDQVGRNFMNHNASAMLALHPLRRNASVYQKTLMLNDFYLTGGPGGAPLGNVQLLGKVSGGILASQSGLPRILANWIAARSVDLYLMSEDLPDPESRVTVKGDRIVLDWRRSNWAAHEALVARMKAVMRRAGFPIVLSRAFDRRTPSHQCGTARMGHDPRDSVVDVWGRSHDIKNLFIADASVLPTSAAVNPALTIAAHALRVADHIAARELSP